MPTKTFTCNADARLLEPNLGSGACDHLSVGTYGGATYRSLLKFALDWTGVVKIVSAVLYVRTSDHYHVSPDNVTVEVRRVTASWSEGSVGHPASTGNAVVYPGPSTTSTGAGSFSSGTAANTWKTRDITAIVEEWAPASVQKSDGSAGGAQANNGIRLASTSEGTDISTEFWSRETSSDAYILLTYDSNSLPNAPVNRSTDGKPAGSVVSIAPVIEFQHDDPDGDAILNYDLQVSTDSTFASVTHWNISNQTASIHVDGTVARTYAGTALTGGTTYYWRARTASATGTSGDGAWSAAMSFIPNRAPTVTGRVPGNANPNRLAYIHNLQSSLALWTSGGTDARPRLEAVYDDPDGNSMSKVRFRVYNDNAGAAGTLRWDSGDVLLSASDLKTIRCDVGSTVSVVGGTSKTVAGTGTAGIVNGTQYWWSIEVWDSYGEDSLESTKTAFKVRWGQGLYEFNAGGSSSSWQFSSSAVGGGAEAQVGFIFRSASSSGGDAATGKTSFKTTIGSVTVQAWMQVCVRIATNGEGTQPALPDMTFSYVGSATTPDRWVFSSQTSEFKLDPSERRYGSQCMRVDVQSGVTGNRFMYPFRKTSGDDVLVLPETTYTLSAWIKTDAPLTGGSISIRLYQAGGNSVLRANSGGFTDTAAFEGGWRRISVTYTTKVGETAIRPMVHYQRSTGVTETFWVDAVKLEEGNVASAWTPGFVGEPVVLDANGIVVDGTAGGVMRWRGSGAGSRDVFELGPNGILFTDVELFSSATGVLETDGQFGAVSLRLSSTTDVTLASTGHAFQIGPDGSTNLVMDPNEIMSRNNGATNALALNAEGGTVSVGANAAAGAKSGALDLGPATTFSGGGSSFPTGPATNDMFYRTDHDMWFFYDGTRWVCTCLHEFLESSQTAVLSATTTTLQRSPMPHSPWGGDIWVVDCEVIVNIASGGTALGASHKWVGTFRKENDTGGTPVTIGTCSVDSGASGVWKRVNASVAAVVAVATYFGFFWDYTKTGTPGNSVWLPKYTYRLIAT